MEIFLKNSFYCERMLIEPWHVKLLHKPDMFAQVKLSASYRCVAFLLPVAIETHGGETYAGPLSRLMGQAPM